MKSLTSAFVICFWEFFFSHHLLVTSFWNSAPQKRLMQMFLKYKVEAWARHVLYQLWWSWKLGPQGADCWLISLFVICCMIVGMNPVCLSWTLHSVLFLGALFRVVGWEFSFTKRFIAQGADRHSFWVMMNQQANKKLWAQAHQNLQHEQSKLIAWPKTQCMQQLEVFWEISYTRWPDAGYGDVGHLTIFSARSLLKQLGNLTRGSLKQLWMCGGTEAIVPVILLFCLQTCSPAQT